MLDKIRKQLEFYFSDSNYSKDRFLQETAIKNDGWVPIKTILTFKRVEQLGATMEDIISAGKDSELFEIKDESIKKIETKQFLEYKSDKELIKKVVHISGFNSDETLDEISRILEEFCSPVRISMRRNKEKEFIGSCFVEFGTVKEAEDSLNLEIKYPEEHNDEENIKKIKTESNLKIISKEEFNKTIKKSEKENEQAKFVEKVKKDFIPKLYKFSCEKEGLVIDDIKKVISNVAFVDLENKIVRMKYREPFSEKEFEGEGYKVMLEQLSEEDAKDYVDKINITKVIKK